MTSARLRRAGRRTSTLGRELPRGLIFEIARGADIELLGAEGPKRPIRCPFHDDRQPSAFVSEDNVFYCSVCTPDRGWPAKRFARELGVPWPGRGLLEPTFRAPIRSTPVPSLSSRQAQELWFRARARAGNQAWRELDAEVHAYLGGRGLNPALKAGLVGVIGENAPLPEPIGWWPKSGYRLVAPVFDLEGTLVNVQARAVRDVKPKVRFPKGTRAKGTVFASGRGQRLLRGEDEGGVVILGEGLTDSLALALCSPFPVLAAPGTGMAVSSLGAWAKGRTICLALDQDEPGERATAEAAQAAYGQGAERVRRVSWPGGCVDACDAFRVMGHVNLGHLLARCGSDA